MVHVQPIEQELFAAAIHAARLWVLVSDASGRLVSSCGPRTVAAHQGTGPLAGRITRDLLPPGIATGDRDRVLDVDAEPVSVQASHIDASGAVRAYVIHAITHVVRKVRFRSLCVVDLGNFGVSWSGLHDLRARLDAMNTAVLVLDATRMKRPILSVNRRFENLTGYTSADCVGQAHTQLNGPLTEPAAMACLAQGMARGQCVRVDITLHRKDASAFRATIIASPGYSANGKLHQYVLTLRARADREVPAARMTNGTCHGRRSTRTMG